MSQRMLNVAMHDTTKGRFVYAATTCTVVSSKLDFVQLRRIAERFSEAFQQCAWDLNHIGRLLGR